MNIPLIILNLIAWPVTYVFMAIGFNRWFLEVSIAGVALLILLLLLLYKTSKSMRFAVLAATTLSMFLTNIIPYYLPYIFAILVPLLALTYLAFSNKSKSHEKLFLNVYLTVCFSYVFISGAAFVANDITIIFYHWFIEELPVLTESISALSNIKSNVIVLITTILVIAPSFGSVIGVHMYRKKDA